LTHQLTSFKTNGSGLNGLIIWSLIELKAVDAIDAIRAAYFADCVDLTIVGDIEDVEIEMGLRRNRETPRPKYHLYPTLDGHQSDAARDPVWDNAPGRGTTNPFKHVGRNDPCPCGSGKKFKKCCLQ
jgi:preprotein translocase subunit SecA